jgi:hypothetical protein
VQLTTWLGQIVKSGAITLTTGNVEALRINAEDNKIAVSIADKEFLKDVFGSAVDGKSLRSKLAQLKSIATELKVEGLTVTLSYKGDLLVTIGSEAKPKFSHLLTRVDSVEINNLRKLIQLTL